MVEKIMVEKIMSEGRMRRGSVSVLLLCLLAGIVPLFLFMYGHATRRTLQSAVSWNCCNAGQSVLTYYIPELESRYGMYAMWREEDVISGRMEKFAQTSSPFWQPEKRAGLLRARWGNLTLATDGYTLMDTEEIRRQISRLMEYGGLLDGIRETEMISRLLEALQLAAEGMRRKEQVEDGTEIPSRSGAGTLPVAAPSTSDSAAGDGDAEEDELRRLKQEVVQEEKRGIQALDDIWADGGRTLTDPERIAALPSRQLANREKESLWNLLKAGYGQIYETILSSLQSDLYALKYFGNYCDRKDSWFAFEVEYLVGGQLSDEANLQRVKQELFLLRTVLNLAAIYRDGELHQAVGALAVAAAPVPQPVATALIGMALSACEASGDVKKLMSGDKLPLLKPASQWAGLDVVDTLAKEGGGDAGALDYRDHLHLLLLLRSPENKLVRMMDLIQLNMGEIWGEEFTLKDCCSGFQWSLQTLASVGWGREVIWYCEGISRY